MSEIILPCKKCGSKSIDKNRYPECFYLSCDDCGYSVDGYDQESTLKLWNRRKAREVKNGN